MGKDLIIHCGGLEVINEVLQLERERERGRVPDLEINRTCYDQFGNSPTIINSCTFQTTASTCFW